jgi:tRNA dimethylallyltransferase
VAQYLKEEISLDEMVSDLATKIGQFAKRQMTWLKRDKTIKWFQKKDTDTIFQTVKTFVEDR